MYPFRLISTIFIPSECGNCTKTEIKSAQLQTIEIRPDTGYGFKLFLCRKDVKNAIKRYFHGAWQKTVKAVKKLDNVFGTTLKILKSEGKNKVKKVS